MASKGSVFQNLDQEYTILIEQILDVIRNEFTLTDDASFYEIFEDFIKLYNGESPKYEACQTGYHNLRHAIEVALVAIRMASGYNLIEKSNQFELKHFKTLIIAALYHDSGYLKDKGDNEGAGGKYTFTHVARSAEIAKDYLSSKKYSQDEIDLVRKIIQVTDFSKMPAATELKRLEQETTLVNIIGTADLIAQMADVNYMENIKHLFVEFQEAYKFHGNEYLVNHDITVYESAEEMIEQTGSFYSKFVVPRFELLGRKDKYLISFFGEGRNPYLENISVNIHARKSNNHSHWRRIGDILLDYGVVDESQIKTALSILKQFQEQNPAPVTDAIPFRERFQSWLKGEKKQKNLGLVLIENEMVAPSLLRKGLIDQIIPTELIDHLSRKDVIFLLQASIMLHNVSKDAWIFEQIMVMANEMLPCEASTILLANPDKREMFIAVSTTIEKKYYLGRTLPLDKGLSGWVFLQDQPAIVDNVESDERYDIKIDKRVNFEPHCILAVPLHVNGKPIGVMEFFNKSDGEFNQNDIHRTTLLANVIAASLSKALTLNTSQAYN